MKSRTERKPLRGVVYVIFWSIFENELRATNSTTLLPPPPETFVFALRETGLAGKGEEFGEMRSGASGTSRCVILRGKVFGQPSNIPSPLRPGNRRLAVGQQPREPSHTHPWLTALEANPANPSGEAFYKKY